MNDVEETEKRKQEGRAEAEVLVTRDLLKELARKNGVTFDAKSRQRVEQSQDARELKGMYMWVARLRDSAVSLAK